MTKRKGLPQDPLRRITKEHHPLVSTLGPEALDGWRWAMLKAAPECHMDPVTLSETLEKVFPYFVQAMARGMVVRMRGLGMVAPYAPIRRRGLYVKYRDFPRHCVMRFRPEAKANAIIINQAPVRRAVNAHWLTFVRRSGDMDALRLHDQLVAAGELPPNNNLLGLPRTVTAGCKAAARDGRIVKRHYPGPKPRPEDEPQPDPTPPYLPLTHRGR